MNVQKINNSIPSFQGINNLTKNPRFAKEITQFDKECFRAYIKSAEYRMDLNNNELKNLFKYTGDKFIQKAFAFIFKKLNIPKNPQPGLEIIEIEDNNNIMKYSFTQNLISYAPDNIAKKQFTKAEIFAILRHEIQHFCQNVQILRHEDIGKKAVDLYAEAMAKDAEAYLNSYFSNYSLEDSIQMLIARGGQPKFILDYAQAYKNNDTKEMKRLMDYFAAGYKKSLEIERNHVISAFSIIKKDDKLTPKIQKLLDEALNDEYYNPDGSVDENKYLQSKIEQDAFMAQITAAFQCSKEKCFIRFVKPGLGKLLPKEACQKIFEALDI